MFGKILVARAAILGMDEEGGEWVTICRTHSTAVNSETKEIAQGIADYEFCDRCRGIHERLEAAKEIQK